MGFFWRTANIAESKYIGCHITSNRWHVLMQFSTPVTNLYKAEFTVALLAVHEHDKIFLPLLPSSADLCGIILLWKVSQTSRGGFEGTWCLWWVGNPPSVTWSCSFWSRTSLDPAHCLILLTATQKYCLSHWGYFYLQWCTLPTSVVISNHHPCSWTRSWTAA